MAEKINPTRMELIKAKGRIKLARKGHELLKKKRDALIMDFFKILEKAKDLRGELEKTMQRAYIALGMAEAYHGVFEVENIALSVKPVSDVEVKIRNVMGVKIPSVKGEISKKGLLNRGYSLKGTSAKIDESCELFEEALLLIFKLAETEVALKRLLAEIEKTKRRVNALEYIIIPSLHSQARGISFTLEEMERDSFFTLKMIKKKLNAREQMEKAEAMEIAEVE